MLCFLHPSKTCWPDQYYYSASLSQASVSAVTVIHFVPSRTCSSQPAKAHQQQKQKKRESRLINQTLVLPSRRDLDRLEQGQTGISWSSVKGTAEPCAWGGTTPHTGSGRTVWEAAFPEATPGSWWITNWRWASNVPSPQRPAASPELLQAQHTQGGDRPLSARSWGERFGALHSALGSPVGERHRHTLFCSKGTILNSPAYGSARGLSEGWSYQNSKLRMDNWFFPRRN